MILVQYTFSTATVAPPTGSQVRFNAATPAATTALWIRYTSDDGIDLYFLLAAIALGVELFVQDKNNHLQFARFYVTGPPLDKIDYFEIPVTWVADGGVAFNNTQPVLIVKPTDEPAEPPPVRALWLTYDEAIMQLQRGAEEDRPRVEATMLEACGLVLDYLAERGDPSWTSVTVPLPIKSASKLALTHLYEHRGDDNRLDEDFWDAIGRILARSSDAALA